MPSNFPQYAEAEVSIIADPSQQDRSQAFQWPNYGKYAAAKFLRNIPASMKPKLKPWPAQLVIIGSNPDNDTLRLGLHTNLGSTYTSDYLSSASKEMLPPYPSNPTFLVPHYRFNFSGATLKRFNDFESMSLGVRAFAYYGGTARLYNDQLRIYFDFQKDNALSHLEFIPSDTPGELKAKIIMTDEAEVQEANKYHFDEGTKHYATLTLPSGRQIVSQGVGRVMTFQGVDEYFAESPNIEVELAAYIGSPPSYVGALSGLIQSKVLTGDASIAFAQILSLEPDGVSVNVNDQLVVSWASLRQERFELIVNGVVFTGDAATSVVVSASALVKGTNQVTLKVYGSGGYSTKTVTFTGYGKPELPIFTEQELFNTARPTLTWTAPEQHTYRLRVFKVSNSELIADSGEVVSTEAQHAIAQLLENNTDYLIKLKVANDKGIWSDEATKQIHVSFSQLAPATLSLFSGSDATILVNVTNADDSDFDYCEVHRKAAYEKNWRRIAKNGGATIAFTDTLLSSGTRYQYKVLSFNKQGGATESPIKEASVQIDSIEFIDLGTMRKITGCYSDSPDEAYTVQRIRDIAVMSFEGLSAPIIEIGGTDYRTVQFSFVFRSYQDFKEFESAMTAAPVILFRSPHGHFLFGHITASGDESIDAVGFVSVGFTFTETAFKQGEIYDAGKLLKVLTTESGYELGSEG